MVFGSTLNLTSLATAVGAPSMLSSVSLANKAPQYFSVAPQQHGKSQIASIKWANITPFPKRRNRTMAHIDWILSDTKIISSEEQIVGKKDVHKRTCGCWFFIPSGLGYNIQLNKREFRRKVKELPDSTKYRFRVDTYKHPSPNYETTYEVVTYLGIAFDPDNWRGNLHLASPKQIIDLLHKHGQEVVNEAH